MFGSDNNEDRYEEDNNSKKGSGAPIVFLLGILMLPAVLIGIAIWGLFRFVRLRLSVILTVSASIIILALTYGTISDAVPKALFVFMNITEFKENWKLLIPLAVVTNLVIGSIGGFIFAAIQIRKMNSSPHMIELEGTWSYKFEFRKTLFEVLKKRRVIAGLKSGAYADPKRAPLGLNEENGDLVAYRYNSEATKQTLMSGAAGSGKTITMLSMILNDIKAGLPLIIIDFKRSPEMATKISTWSKEHNRPFYHFVNGDPEKYDVPNSEGQSTYDSLINGGSAKADMILGMREYDVAATVYKDSMRQLLQVLFAALKQADRSKAPRIDWGSGSIPQLNSAIQGNITELASACEGKSIQDDIESVDLQTRAKGANLRHALDELQGQMRTLLASEYGRWLKTGTRHRNINLFKLTDNPAEGNVILFSLNSDSEKDFSKYLGSLIFSDLNAVSALRRNLGKENQVNVYVDEFQAVPPTAVTSLLEKSRESRLGMTLASQSFEQVISSSDKNGEAYLSGILDTCSNFIIHAGSTEDSATRIAKILGKDDFTAYRQTNSNKQSLFSFNFSNRQNQVVQKSIEERWILGPKHFMNLSSPTQTNGYRSTAVIINKAPDDPRFRKHTGALARTVWMIPNSRVIDKYYMPTLASADNEDSLHYESAELSATDSAFEEYEAPLDLLSEEPPYDPNFSNDYDDYDESFPDDEDGDFGWEEIEDEVTETSIETVSREPKNISQSFNNIQPQEIEQGQQHNTSNSGQSRRVMPKRQQIAIPQNNSGQRPTINNGQSRTRNDGQHRTPNRVQPTRQEQQSIQNRSNNNNQRAQINHNEESVNRDNRQSQQQRPTNPKPVERRVVRSSEFDDMFSGGIKPQTLKDSQNSRKPIVPKPVKQDNDMNNDDALPDFEF